MTMAEVRDDLLDLVKPKGTKSAVWSYFGFVKDSEGKQTSKDAAICLMCKKKVIAKGGNTSNLLSHVKIYHPLEHVKLKKSVDASKRCGKDAESSKARNSLSAMLKSAQKYDCNSKKWQKLTDAVTNCLAKDMMAIYSVEKE